MTTLGDSIPAPTDHPTPGSSAELRGTIARVPWTCPEGSGRALVEIGTQSGPVSVWCRLTGYPTDWIHREVHVVGRWQRHERYGLQVQADGIVQAEPRTERGVVKFLRETLGYQESLARKLWTRFREQAPEVMRTDPARIAGTGLLTPEQAAYASRVLARLARHQEAFLSLATLFAGQRMPLGIITACVDRWGGRAPEVVRRDPYILMSLPGYVVGFVRADSLYLALGGDPARLKRQLLFLVHSIQTNRSGHTWRRALDLGEELAAELAKRPGTATPRIVDAIKLGLRAGRLARRRDREGILWVTTASADCDEQDVASKALRLLTDQAPIGGVTHVA